eukprot:CAMPEP_0206035070 /NCGR_PEP_ID=MMETSP1466-20131121/1820_1 /ASSEMBLY_ACC=CAM_ASM_001126 /TAXON_ID=44452 /ORGANISM="Pavlova gyrans, Strain CCMP608" /LENGTH=32 /DNA_ID= /DNA_START= /DNA_END= /DNA_ORIENTATION=
MLPEVGSHIVQQLLEAISVEMRRGRGVLVLAL